MAECNCGRTTRDDAYVCDDDLGELARALGEVPWTVEQLEITLTKARGVDYAAIGGAAGSEVALPLDARALEASGALRHALVTWVRFCVEEDIRNQSPKTGLPADNLPAMSRWLLWRVDGLGLNDLGWDAVSEITRAVGRCRMVIDRPAERVYAGPCQCGRDVYAKPGAKVTKCNGCETEYDVQAAMDWLREQTDGMLVTSSDGSTYLGLLGLPTPKKTIDKWHERKRILDHGKDSEGRNIYSLDELIGLAGRGGKMSA